MNLRVLMHKGIQFAISLVVMISGMMKATQAAPSSEFHASKDGLDFAIRFEKTINPEGMQVRCKVTNRSQSDVPFMNTGPTMGLAFKLLNRAGQEVAPVAPWSAMITSQAIRNTEGKRSSKTIKINENVEFTLALNEAFGDAWKNGASLFIEWIPGDDGAGNPLQTGRGLNTSFDLTGEHPRQLQPVSSTEINPAPTLKPVSAMQSPVPKKISSNAPASPTLSDELSSSTPWSIIVVLIVAATGLLWLLLKGRK